MWKGKSEATSSSFVELDLKFTSNNFGKFKNLHYLVILLGENYIK
jgi:hypothetical protein